MRCVVRYQMAKYLRGDVNSEINSKWKNWAGLGCCRGCVDQIMVLCDLGRRAVCCSNVARVDSVCIVIICHMYLFVISIHMEIKIGGGVREDGE